LIRFMSKMFLLRYIFLFIFTDTHIKFSFVTKHNTGINLFCIQYGTDCPELFQTSFNGFNYFLI